MTTRKADHRHPDGMLHKESLDWWKMMAEHF